MDDDELILRRKKQNADRARAYRKRKKDLDAMPSTSTVQSVESVSENIVTTKLLHQKQLNAERCRRYRQKCKRLKSGANYNRGTSDSNTITSRDASTSRELIVNPEDFQNSSDHPRYIENIESATMERESSERIKGKSHSEMTIKIEVEEAVPSAAYVDIEINLNCTKVEPGLEQFVKSNPALSVKEEILQDNTQGTYEQQDVPATPTQAIISRTSMAVDAAERSQLLHIKEDLKDINLDIGPTVLQHIDTHYRANQMDLYGIERENKILNLNPGEVLSRIDDGQTLRGQVRDDTIGCSWKDDSYKCDKCLKICKSKETLVKHHQQLHGTESHRCTECSKVFKCRAYLLVHINYAHGKQPFECDVCKKVYKSKRALTYHLKVVHSHNRKPAGSRTYIYTCEHCQKKFWRKPALRQHIEGVHGERIHQCRMCDKVYKCRHHLKQHVTIIHGKPEHECEVCHELFTARYILKAHAKKLHSLKNIQSASELPSQEVRDPSPTVGGMSAVADTGIQQHGAVAVKSESADAELELGPVMFQHMDSNYRPLKEEPQHE